jgi:hypothetical protein
LAWDGLDVTGRTGAGCEIRRDPHGGCAWQRWAAAWLMLCALTEIGHTQESESAARREEFVFGNVQFVLLHELAHLLINEKKIPILGSEEYAADYIAAMMLIRPPITPVMGYETLLKFAVDTADGFVIAWDAAARLDAPVPYWGTHALTVQRFSTIACLLYGSDPERFAALPERVQMLPERARSCPVEYEKATFAVDWMFASYARKADDPPGAAVGVRYESPPTRTSQAWRDAIRSQGFVERTLLRFEEFFALDEPMSLVMRSCRQPQAAWMPDTRELVLCYELLDAYALMGARQRAGMMRPLLGD